MLSLFAGIDKNGITRFVGDVERGLACDCFCDACGSPLVARRGDLREWHFAHEARQERPECIAGALNLLRRLAIEHLSSQSSLQLPVYRETLTAQHHLSRFSETAEWMAQPRNVDGWNLHPPKLSPAVRMELDNGAQVDLYVEVGSSSVFERRSTCNVIGELHFWIAMPQAEQLRSHKLAQQHIACAGQMVWVHQPDALGLVADARARIDACLTAAKRATDETERLRHVAAGRRWFDIQQEMNRKRQERASFIPPAEKQASPKPAFKAKDSPWSAWRKQKSALLFYGLQDGSGWLILQHQDGRSILMPWPMASGGWEAAVPSSIGSFESEIGGVVLVNPVSTMINLGAKSKVMCTPSSMDELASIVWPV